ncbi:hypothetical protein GIB67_019426 [Kingdonia uniflora]|uniref:ATP-dependent DNA helicase 2 subunit KU80 n=1 Tax=Kingdonia uniflora TaxID=39325 RepID=A0A7J7L6I3_9MAGN|nr:hypothetical protein GIB67_019426 [Kingdonia uniflora]
MIWELITLVTGLEFKFKLERVVFPSHELKLEGSSTFLFFLGDAFCLIYNKNDEVGVVLFGTEDTNNELTEEIGGYKHVVVLQKSKVVDGLLIEELQKLPRGTIPGDFLDVIVVGMDMLIKKFGPTNKGKKRLCLITNAHGPIKEPYEGTKEDQVDTIATQMNAHGMKLDSIIVRQELTDDAAKRVVDENDRLLNRFSKKACTKTIYVESPTSLLGALRTRNISPVTIFRGDLELSPTMKIKVWVYKKTSEEKFPTLKKYSGKAPLTDKFATHEVKVDLEYKKVEDPSKVVPPEQRIKGYRYGPQVVPISSAELEAVRFKPEKSVKLLGFTNASNIMRWLSVILMAINQRHYYMKDVNIFIAEPGNTKAILAVSALVRAMKEMDKVAILRCVWRQGQGNVVIGILTPNISNMENVPDSFYFNVLPFAEDVREFQFPSFNSFPPSLQPNERQQLAADNLVMMLDLAPPGKEEILQPDFTPNPVLERYYRFLELKSKKPDSDVPLLDKTLKRITEPDPELVSRNNSVIDEFCKQFEVKENPKTRVSLINGHAEGWEIKKSARRLLRDNPLRLDEEANAAGNATDYQSVLSIKDESATKIDSIGQLTPVQDFESMMCRRDSTEWVGKAVKDMKNLIFDLVENSYEGDTYDKAMDCLVALRKGCILEQILPSSRCYFGDYCMVRVANRRTIVVVTSSSYVY